MTKTIHLLMSKFTHMCIIYRPPLRVGLPRFVFCSATPVCDQSQVLNVTSLSLNKSHFVSTDNSMLIPWSPTFDEANFIRQIRDTVITDPHTVRQVRRSSRWSSRLRRIRRCCLSPADIDHIQLDNLHQQPCNTLTPR